MSNNTNPRIHSPVPLSHHPSMNFNKTPNAQYMPMDNFFPSPNRMHSIPKGGWSMPQRTISPNRNYSASYDATETLKKSLGLSTSPVSSPIVEPDEKEQGVRLLTSLENYTIGENGKQNLKVESLTLFPPSDYSYHTGYRLAVNENYICYIVRVNLVRVICQSTGNRGLVKGHKAIMDIHFCPGKNKLAVVDVEGLVSVWALEAVEGKVITENIMKMQVEEEYFNRVQWHPTDSDILAISSSYGTILLLTISSVSDGVYEDPNDTFDDIEKIEINMESEVLDLNFSVSGKFLAATSSDGFARIMDLEGSVKFEFIPHEESPVYCFRFCNDSDNLFVTGGEHNMELKLFQLTDGDIDCLQTIRFKSKETSKTHGNRFEMDTDNGFLFVTNTLVESFCILHMTEPVVKNNELFYSNTRFDYISEYVLKPEKRSVDNELVSAAVISCNIRKDSASTDVVKMYCARENNIQMFTIPYKDTYTAYQLPEPEILSEETNAPNEVTTIDESDTENEPDSSSSSSEEILHTKTSDRDNTIEDQESVEIEIKPESEQIDEIQDEIQDEIHDEIQDEIQ
eukprot:TRINITY_DN723_c0_g1_i3.p1 TRINITY_DN723_c0_g1~~TRINITY_DN723_c0_g1_i3.p1  ORF type:complete len:580 (-),score=139.00 TRINITY_DN723_c0_g1_i3:115-1821(-)